MASGKSSVGAALAARTGAPLVDLDRVVEARAGVTVAELFRARGEAEFRALERAALGEVLARGDGPVVALGGGTLVDRAARLDALDRAVVVTLDVDPAELVRRALAQGGRPLLEGPDPAGRVGELLQARAGVYAECHARLAAGDRPVEAIAADVEGIWRRDPCCVAAGDRSYRVEVGRDLAAGVPELVGAGRPWLVVTDEHVAPLHVASRVSAWRAEGHPAELLVLPPGERHKTVASLTSIWERALASGLDRGSTFVAFGGGVVGDVTGFAAATYQRGVAWIGLPTTLLAQVDASVGGKTAVDLGPVKNVVGAFWQPRRVLCDVSTLATEPMRGFVAALAEVVKTALIGDPGLFSLLEDHADSMVRRDPDVVSQLVRRSVRVKARIVSADERETGLRAVLNLGHTIGHALESQGGFDELAHGEAVALGLVAILRWGERLGVTPPALRARTVSLLSRLGLPTELSAEALERAAPYLGSDKKRAGARVTLVLAREVGDVTTRSVDLGELARALPSLAG